MQRESGINLIEANDLSVLYTPRAGEEKVGDVLKTLASYSGSSVAERVVSAKKAGVRFLLVGIPEDIGVRANLGRPGAKDGWEAFLKVFLNTQSNRAVDFSAVAIVGAIDVDDLQSKASEPYHTPDELRKLTGELDGRVGAAIAELSECELIVIGGGHNNTYPIQKGINSLRNRNFSVVNCDPHLDYRALEGRHSGNGFRYARADGILDFYSVFGWHEAYNSELVLADFESEQFHSVSYEDIKLRMKHSFEEALSVTCSQLKKASGESDIGIELDLDAIRGVPTSAESPTGFSLEEGARFVYALAENVKDIRYLYLPEGAPSLGATNDIGGRYVGRALMCLTLAYLKGRP